MKMAARHGALVLICVLGITPTLDAAALDLELQGPSSPRLEEFRLRLMEVLPASLRFALGGRIVVRFEPLAGAELAALATCPEGPSPIERVQLGKIARRFLRGASYLLTLDLGFLREIEKGPEESLQYGCGHRSLYRLALATAVHEVAHAYDRLGRPPERALQDQIAACTERWQGEDSPAEECRQALAARRTVSDRLPFLLVMGLADTPSHSGERSVDPREYASPEERLAVNMEHFLLDPEFACRRPAIHGFLASHFGHDPFPDRACKINTKVHVAAASFSPERWAVTSLDPSRVHEVHYLMAGRGPQIMSHWGHAMLRIVTCAPHRTAPGPDCLEDVNHHVVVSYRANVTGTTVSTWAGLTGGYPSQLFLLKMMDVVDEYTVGEGREVFSIPLRLTPEELGRLLKLVLERTWQYKNRYFFIGNNCGTEALNLLRAAVWPRPFSRYAALPVAPTGVRAMLRDHGLSDESVLGREGARGRYHFRSIHQTGEESFRRLTRLARRVGVAIPGSSKQLISGSSPRQRRDLFERIRSTAPDQAQEAALYFYELELLARNQLTVLAERRALELVEQSAGARDGGLAERATRIQRQRSSLEPWSLAPTGYGIPDAEEFSRIDAAPLLKDLSREVDSFLATIEAGLGDVVKAGEESSLNMARFLRIAAPSGQGIVDRMSRPEAGEERVGGARGSQPNVH
jgi:hypothetical protein